MALAQSERSGVDLPEVDLHTGDCLDVLSRIADESIHLVVTDPPYFLDGLDDGWAKGKGGARGTGAIGGLPVGMRFDVAQGRNLQAFLTPVAIQLYRVLKPGAFLLMFAAPRLYHRTAVAVEEAGFEVRDQYVWHYRGKAQFKASKQDHRVEERSDLTDLQKERIIQRLNGRRTPQLRPQFESILCAQKPKIGTFVENWLAHETGLIDASQTLNGSMPETVMFVEKHQKAKNINHLTPKPVKLCEHLIRVFSMTGQIVLDPFVGSGTTCLAARRAGRRSIGIDINSEYIEYSRKQLEGSL